MFKSTLVRRNRSIAKAGLYRVVRLGYLGKVVHFYNHMMKVITTDYMVHDKLS